jgi:hypothetical protein
MANIARRAFVLTPNPDVYLTLAAEDYVRTLLIGNSWTTIRLGIQFALTANGTGGISGACLALGMCSGKTNPVGAATTTNFIGSNFFNFAGSLTANLSYVANAGNPLYQYANGGNIFKRVGSTNTFANGSNAPEWDIAQNAGTLQRRSAVYVDVTKGSPNYTVRTWFQDTTAKANVDYSFSHFMAGLQGTINIAPVLNGTTWGNGGSASLAMSEAAGILDTVDCFWNKVTQPLELYAIGAFQLA